MASPSGVTAIEEMQRYYRKAKAVAQPVIDKIVPQDGASEPDSKAEGQAIGEMFNDDIAEGEDGWVDVFGSVETPTENNQENHRLATGTGPIEVAKAKLRHQIEQFGIAAARKASLASGVVKTCAEYQVEHLAEGIGRVTVSNAATALLQRYPLLKRWRLAFFRGRKKGGQAMVAASPSGEVETCESKERQLADEMPFALGDGEMEDVPLEEEEGMGEEDWEQAV